MYTLDHWPAPITMASYSEEEENETSINETRI
jgi:hypothetical protein